MRISLALPVRGVDLGPELMSARAGVIYACVSLRGETLNESVAETERFGQTVIGKLAG